MADFKYECHYCGMKFLNESRYLKHHCKMMDREQEFNTAIGQSAWFYYQSWMKSNRKFVPNSKSFLHSKFYATFIRFAKHVRKVQLPDVDFFIKFMSEKGITPTIWTNDQIYSLYLEHLDRTAAPQRRAKITIDNLLKIADAAEVEISEVFNVLEPNDVIMMLRQRRLSPWILLRSPKFSQFVKTKTTAEERIILESIIRPDFWVEKFSKNPEVVKKMNEYVKAMDL